jgi:hypothetical protein
VFEMTRERDTRRIIATQPLKGEDALKIVVGEKCTRFALCALRFSRACCFSGPLFHSDREARALDINLIGLFPLAQLFD